MEHIAQSLDQVLINITVRQMLNPENPDFYIGTLTLEKVKELFVEMNDPSTDAVTIFWKAFDIALAKYKKEQAYDKDCALDDVACEYAKHNNHSYYGQVCPKCGCTEKLGYTEGVACPNCDYVAQPKGTN